MLAVPNEYIDSSGVVKHNDSAADFLFSPIDGNNIDDQLIIGKQFFSGAYLTVNVDNQTWSIWPAKATSDTEITAIGDQCEEVTSSTTSPPSDSSSEPPSVSSSSDSAALSTGAIAGIAAGGGCVVLALIGLLFFFAMRKRKRKRTAAARFPAAYSDSSASDPHDWHNGSRQNAFVPGPMQELAGSQTVPYELASDAKPVEMAHDTWGGRKSSRYHAVELPTSRY